MQLGTRTFFCYFACWAVSGMLSGQPYEIEPVTAEWVPMAESYADGRTAPLGAVTGMAAGPNGDVYFTCRDLRRVFRLTAGGRVEVVAGTGKAATERWTSEREARGADLGYPEGLVVDGQGNLFFSDWAGLRMFRVGGNGRIRVVAGTGRNKPRADDLPALEVSLNAEGQMTLGPRGEVVFYDHEARAIRELRQDGILGTFVGDEPKTSPRVMHSRLDMAAGGLTALSVDSKGVAWIAVGKDLSRVDFVTARRFHESPLAEAPGCTINHLAHSKAGGIVVACEAEGELRVYDSAGAKPRVLKRHVPAAVFDSGGAVVFAEGNRIYRMARGRDPIHVAGTGVMYGDGGAATAAWLSGVLGVTVDRQGNVLVADRLHHLVRRVRADGVIETVAGNGEAGSTGDGGPGTEARVGEPMGVGQGPDGAIFVLTARPPAIRRLGVDGVIGTVWRNGGGGVTLRAPTALAVDREGRVVFSDAELGRIFLLERDGGARAVAGTGQISVARGAGPALTTPLGRVSGLNWTSDGGLLFTQHIRSNLLRRLTVDGRIENLAGNDDRHEMQRGVRPATELGLQEPRGAAELPGEGILVSSAYQVLLVRKDWMAVRYASSDDINQGYAGIAVDRFGNAYVADYSAGVLRIVRRSGGLAASKWRMPERPLPLKPMGHPLSSYVGNPWFWVGLALAPIPFAVRRWRYWRQKARLSQGVDADVSAVFSPGVALPRAGVSGTLDGRYRIVESVAAGGTASVYRAEDLKKAGRAVAVKVFDVLDEDPAAMQRRLLREMAAVGRVKHAAVSPMLDVGMTEEGQPYLVMEFIEGESLRGLLRRGAVDRARGVRLLREMAEAVKAAHEQGVLHLDIKPENLMIREDGRLVLIDFGLAALAEGEGWATRMTGVGGTFDYMAPEQAQGHISRAADVYACGAVALEVLSGKRVAGLELPANNQDLGLTARRIREAVPGLGEEAAGLLARTLSLQPEERPESLEGFLDAI